MSTPPTLSIVIPTWNRRDLIASCLESSARQTYRDFETIVVDDGSTDDTVVFLTETYPDVQVIECGENRGFAVAVNRGIAVARGAWVLLLNNDVTLAEDCLEHLMAAAGAGEAAMLTPLVLWTADPRLLYSAGDTIGRQGRPSSIGYRIARADFPAFIEPFGVSGGYGLFKRELLDTAGGLDTAFGAYFEDSDLCFRARWLGYRAAVVSEAVAWHVGSATIQDQLWWRTCQCYRNHALLVLKNFSWPMLWWNAGPLLRERRHQLGRVFRAARNEWGTVRAVCCTAAVWWGLAIRIPGALVRRRRVMASRRISNRAMQQLLEVETPDA